MIHRVSGNKKIFYVAISDGVVLKKKSFNLGGINCCSRANSFVYCFMLRTLVFMADQLRGFCRDFYGSFLIQLYDDVCGSGGEDEERLLI